MRHRAPGSGVVAVAAGQGITTPFSRGIVALPDGETARGGH
ncbi:hypothetical protein [Actinomadura logoneensis]|nr:hypothetical protein [Actinomadura logoneensis]